MLCHGSGCDGTILLWPNFRIVFEIFKLKKCCLTFRVKNCLFMRELKAAMPLNQKKMKNIIVPCDPGYDISQLMTLVSLTTLWEKNSCRLITMMKLGHVNCNNLFSNPRFAFLKLFVLCRNILDMITTGNAIYYSFKWCNTYLKTFCWSKFCQSKFF